MCLTTVTSLKKEMHPPGKWSYGWKCVKKTPTLNQTNYFVSMFNTTPTPFDKWLKATNTNIKGPLFPQSDIYYMFYPSGFHIFQTRKEARRWKEPGEIVVKVRYRHVVARGTERKITIINNHDLYIQKLRIDHLRCIVAKEMYVENPSRKKPSTPLTKSADSV